MRSLVSFDHKLVILKDELQVNLLMNHDALENLEPSAVLVDKKANWERAFGDCCSCACISRSLINNTLLRQQVVKALSLRKVANNGT